MSHGKFMPNGVTKTIFADFLKYYDRDVFISAGREIRKLAANADTLTPTERAIAISRIFRYFKNPDKETVLTPWRVVNMHMSDTLGGWCFYDEDFETLLEEPRFIDQGEATTQTVNNPDAQILEINSKSGLYPLYVTYSIYRAKLGEKSEGETDITELNRLWYEAVAENIFVICKTPMAKSITRRTLLGYQNSNFNAHYFDDLINMLRNKPEQFKKRILKGSYWKKEVKEMKFDAVVGNPPYQENIGSTGNDSLAKQLFPDFIKTSILLNVRYTSLVTPSRWFTADAQDKSFLKLRDFIRENNHFKKIVNYPDNRILFKNVSIGAVNYFLYDNLYTGNVEFIECNTNGTSVTHRPLFESDLDVIIATNSIINIANKVRSASDFESFLSFTQGRNAFGIVGKESELLKNTSDTPFDDSIEVFCAHEKIRYIDKKKISKNIDLVDKWKIFTSKGNGGAGTLTEGKAVAILGKSFIGKPGSACSDSLIPIGNFDSEIEAINLKKYMETKFLRFMVGVLKVSQNISQTVYRFVPIQDFTQEWTDEKLYKKYGLTDSEIEYIENSIKPMADTVEEITTE